MAVVQLVLFEYRYGIYRYGILLMHFSVIIMWNLINMLSLVFVYILIS